MYLVYTESDGAEPKRWKYQPKKLMSAEREKLERLTGRNFGEFCKDVLAANSLCRRALLFIFLKREHPTTRFEDVDFAWDQLVLEYSKGEWRQIRDNVAEGLSGDQLAAALERIDAEIEAAYEDPDQEGKAPLPIAD